MIAARHVRPPLICLLVLLAVGGCRWDGRPAPSGIVWERLEHDGEARRVGVYRPAAAAAPAPLVLHGGGGSASETWEREDGRRWRALADAHGFVLALPEGRPDPGAADAHHWNDCRTGIDNPEADSAADDVGFIARLVEALGARVPLDRGRVYATGASNGGMMAYRLAIELDGLAAVGAIVANLPAPGECAAPQAAVPVLIMNGTADPLMPYAGGCVASARCERGRVRSTEETVAAWVRANGADPAPAVEALPDRVAADRSTVTRLTHAGPTPVVLYRIEGGGHTIPGPAPLGAAAQAILGPKNRDIDGPTEIWAFFAAN